MAGGTFEQQEATGASKHATKPGEEMSLKYAVIFERSENNWAAYVPDLPGCITTGRTPDETERNIQEAIRGHIRALREFGEPLPDPVSLAREIDVPPAA
jgi:predicted RNase H-like HicB family nuclease